MGLRGKTISLSIKNFWGEATLEESSDIQLIPHPIFDNLQFKDHKQLNKKFAHEGYHGGIVLLQATCRIFFNYCEKQKFEVNKNFHLKYDTNIPRQVGLAGSSAIITSVMKCLIQFYEIKIPIEILPQLILDVETKELNINAGLQDRVVQVYEGLIYMDFNKEYMHKHGHGIYQRLSPPRLPKLFIVYSKDPTHSGKIHSNVKQRWMKGEPEVIEGMKNLAKLTDEAKVALIKGDFGSLGELINSNFDHRRSMYDVQSLGENNLNMIEIAREVFNCPCKFPGSGGAVLGIIIDDSKETLMQKKYESLGYKFVVVEPYLP
ncbi:GLCAK [Lepeophtheirus salmonis]|uniref:GLCAK n=1 Tax=Lepeophtheirus salmonis TaxID=72036 RepID=A0A7R8H4J3_LEPSM|nr:GLCAK [Lepeophtheirus salmonis]CAF2849743.1 GLCAK [Lepeophtheirus salmonis]